jgi:hypothetical protein
VFAADWQGGGSEEEEEEESPLYFEVPLAMPVGRCAGQVRTTWYEEGLRGRGEEHREDAFVLRDVEDGDREGLEECNQLGLYAGAGGCNNCSCLLG